MYIYIFFFRATNQSPRVRARVQPQPFLLRSVACNYIAIFDLSKKNDYKIHLGQKNSGQLWAGSFRDGTQQARPSGRHPQLKA